MEDARSGSRGNGSPPPSYPSDEEAEQALLGLGLVYADAALLVAGLDTELFTQDRHRVIRDAIGRLYTAGVPVNTVTVVDDLARHGTLERVGKEPAGRLYVHHLYEGVGVPDAAGTYAEILGRLARQRRMLLAAGQAAHALAQPDADPEAVWAGLLGSAETLGAREDPLVTALEFADPDGPETEAVWGRGSKVLWASGEPLILAGPPGIGKTTVAERLVLASLGVGPTDVGGYPVKAAERPWLYVAADRPRQAARSLRRMIDEAEAWASDDLQERFRVWKGPLGWDIAKEPERLATWARQLGVGGVVIDSLKDVAGNLSEPEIGQGIHLALAHLVSNDIEVLALHHQRKATPDNRTPRSLDDVFGSAWITAGAGSVLLLWGKPGDPVFDVQHLKQPVEEVGPMRFEIDHAAGLIHRIDSNDPLSILRIGANGFSARQVAERVYATQEPREADIEKVRRQLQSLETEGLAHRQPMALAGKGRPEYLWFPVATQQGALT
jgi:replicative DNA helicase